MQVVPRVESSFAMASISPRTPALIRLSRQIEADSRPVLCIDKNPSNVHEDAGGALRVIALDGEQHLGMGSSI